MKYFKSYREQRSECKKRGKRFNIKIAEVVPFEDNVKVCGPSGEYVLDPRYEIIVCVPNKTHCHSAACKKNREDVGV